MAALAVKHEKLDQIAVIMPVKDVAHARSEEVLTFAIKKLQEGHTWQELRRMFGLGHSGVDARWRTIKEVICSSVMPANEEEALMASYSMANYTLDCVEKFVERVQERSKAAEGKKEESNFLKVELEAMKLQLESSQKKFEHYAKMKDLVKADKINRGQSIIVQNNYYIPRPGDKLEEAKGIARKVIEAARIDGNDTGE